MALHKHDGNNLAVPWAVKWKPGRYYGSPINIGALTGTGNPSTNVFLSPLYVPQDILIRTIGCEVTTLGTGSRMRIALYRSDMESGLPDELVVDTSFMNTDSTGFKEKTINFEAAMGLYWMGLAKKDGAGAPSFRALSGTVLCLLLGGYPSDLAVINNVIHLGGIGNAITDFGFPRKLRHESMSGGGTFGPDSQSPSRILVGV